jgi:putative lipoic acid-binding regulatory protein
MSDTNKPDLPSDVQETLMEFPCDFPLKVFVKPESDVDQQILTLLEPHVGALPLSAVQRKVSRTGKFISLTVNFTATGKPQVDAVFAALQGHPLVVMAM